MRALFKWRVNYWTKASETIRKENYQIIEKKLIRNFLETGNFDSQFPKNGLQFANCEALFRTLQGYP